LWDVFDAPANIAKLQGRGSMRAIPSPASSLLVC
jgi:hypothetical protein